MLKRDFIEIIDGYELQVSIYNGLSGTVNVYKYQVKAIIGPRQTNLCLRAFRHDKF